MGTRKSLSGLALPIGLGAGRFILLGMTLVIATVGLLLAQAPIVDAVTRTPGASGAILPRVWAAIEQVRYRIESDARTGTYMARNPRQHLEAIFTPTGLRVRSLSSPAAPWVWKVSLQRWGYGEALKPVPGSTLVASEHRIEYRRGSLSEWYVNSPLGLEQGFTLERPPAVRNPERAGAPKSGKPSPLVLRVALSGDLVPIVEDGGRRLVLRTTRGQRVLRLSDLKAWDARGRVLTSWMEVRGRDLVLLVADADAVYPVVVDPLLTVESKLTASDAAGGDEFGNAVAIDGDTAVIGAVERGCAGGANCGAAYVFVRSGATWSQQQRLTASDAAAGDAFGGSVAVSGGTVVVAAPGKACSAGATCGAVYVFVQSGTTWSQQQKLTASDAAAGDEFGESVAVSGDTIVAGASLKACPAGIACGAAYVFVRNGVTWNQQQELTASDRVPFDQFAHSVAVSVDTAVIGAPDKACPAGIACGAAYVFVRSGTAWSEQQTLTATDTAAVDLLGTAVDVSGDTAIAGAPLKACAAGTGCGAVYVFVRSGTTWAQQQALAASDGAKGDNVGIAVAVSGNTAVAGTALKACAAGARCGAAYVFERSGATWSQQQALTASDAAAGDEFGESVAVSGGTVLVGALGKTCAAGVGCGAAYVFAAPASQSPIAKCKDVRVNNDPRSCRAAVTPEQVNDGSSDQDGDAVTLSLSPAGPYPVGITLATLTVTDPGGASASCQAKITVIDDEAPVISHASAAPSVLWPPNHRMVDVAVDYGVTDNCGVTVCTLAVSSNEPVGGTGDGTTDLDWQIVDGAHVRLRAERAGTGSGRIYTIAPVCTDGSGNSSSQNVNVTVPKSTAPWAQPARWIGNRRLGF